MASVILQVGAEYEAGTSVKAYPASNWLASALPPTGAPTGTESATATVAADGTLTFTGLTDDLDYYAYASSGTPAYVRFHVDLDTGQDEIYSPYGIEIRGQRGTATPPSPP